MVAHWGYAQHVNKLKGNRCKKIFGILFLLSLPTLCTANDAASDVKRLAGQQATYGYQSEVNLSLLEAHAQRLKVPVALDQDELFQKLQQYIGDHPNAASKTLNALHIAGCYYWFATNSHNRYHIAAGKAFGGVQCRQLMPNRKKLYETMLETYQVDLDTAASLLATSLPLAEQEPVVRIYAAYFGMDHSTALVTPTSPLPSFFGSLYRTCYKQQYGDLPLPLPAMQHVDEYLHFLTFSIKDFVGIVPGKKIFTLDNIESLDGLDELTHSDAVETIIFQGNKQAAIASVHPVHFQHLRNLEELELPQNQISLFPAAIF